MYKPTADWNIGRTEVTYAMYKENVHWDRPQRPYLQGYNQQINDYQHWCETCDKGFTTAHFLENHKLQHQKCNIDGCQFIAHPKIITKHIQMQHSTGLFERIAKLNNPEDVKKWRDERKRKYPTIENIKKKEAEIKEKINRGEKMGMKYEVRRRYDKPDFQHTTNQKLSHSHREKRPQGKHSQFNTNSRKRNATDAIKKSKTPKKIGKISPMQNEDSRTLKPFAGIQSFQIDDDLDEKTESEEHLCVPIEDDEEIHNTCDTQKETFVLEPSVCSAITSLMFSYGSSDEEEVETNCKEIKKSLIENISKVEEIQNNNKSRFLSHSKNSQKIDTAEIMCENVIGPFQVPNSPNTAADGPEEIKISKEEICLPVDDNKTSKPKLIKELRPKKINGPSAKTYQLRKINKLPSTLLEKLLHREIQHERNIILQCVRYVVKNKFFDKG